MTMIYVLAPGRLGQYRRDIPKLPEEKVKHALIRYTVIPQQVIQP